jgi:hypothetical protein
MLCHAKMLYQPGPLFQKIWHHLLGLCCGSKVIAGNHQELAHLIAERREMDTITNRTEGTREERKKDQFNYSLTKLFE